MATVTEDQARSMLKIAFEEAQAGYDEGGVPVGAAIFDRDGNLLSRGHNQRVQAGRPSIHGETDAFEKLGRQSDYSNMIMVTSLSPCVMCCGLIRLFKIPTVIIGESENFAGPSHELEAEGIEVVELDDDNCKTLMARFIEERPDIWNEDIGVAPTV